MQINTMMTYMSIPIKMTKMKKSDKTKYWYPLFFESLHYATLLLGKAILVPCFPYAKEIQRGLLLPQER